MSHDWSPLFPFFTHNPDLVYLDSAATTQKPQVVIDAVRGVYEQGIANVHRGMYPLAIQVTERFEQVREDIADFIGASSPQEIIFTKNATEAVNLLAMSLSSTWSSRQNIVISEAEHHANLVPWQQVQQTSGIELRLVRLTERGDIDLDHLRTLIDVNTTLVCVTHCSNVLGAISLVATIKKIVTEQGSAKILLDACQTFPHIPLSVAELGCDFLVASSHKAYGPSGVGFVWGKTELLAPLPPYQTGGGMVSSVTPSSATWTDVPWRFEAGTPNIEGVIGFGAAIAFLKEIGMSRVEQHTASLSTYLMEQLSTLPQVQILGSPTPESGIVSFAVDGMHAHDVAELLGQRSICVRAGHHCAAPLHATFNVQASTRISLGLYSTPKDIDTCVTALREIIQEVNNA